MPDSKEYFVKHLNKVAFTIRKEEQEEEEEEVQEVLAPVPSEKLTSKRSESETLMPYDRFHLFSFASLTFE